MKLYHSAANWLALFAPGILASAALAARRRIFAFVIAIGFMPDPKNKDERSDEETARIRDEIVKRMLKTPPKPHKEEKKK
tara:strand:+ start:2288 stop:2527 length:240 start_codon:yes stop_codon:yes gene_type:complete